MEGTALHPIIGPRGVRFFLEEHVDAVFQSIQRERGWDLSEVSGSLAAQIFGRFRAGMNAVDVVKELRIDSSLVEQLAADWQHFSTTMLLRDAEVLDVRRALHSKSITDGPSFLAAITGHKRSATDHCSRCGDSRAMYCRECARAAGLRALRAEAASRLF